MTLPTDQLLRLRGATGVANQGTLGGSGVYRGGMGTVTNGGVEVFSCDGADDYLDNIGSVSDYSFIHGVGTFTYCQWVKLDDLTKDHFFAGSTLTSAERGFFAVFNVTSSPGDYGLRALRFIVTRAVSQRPYAEGTTDDDIITDTNWHHIGYTVTPGTAPVGQWYVDGVAVNTSLRTLSLGHGGVNPGNANRILNVGRANWSSTIKPLDGLAEDIQIYDRVLTAQEFADIYAAGLDGIAATGNPTGILNNTLRNVRHAL